MRRRRYRKNPSKMSMFLLIGGGIMAYLLITRGAKAAQAAAAPLRPATPASEAGFTSAVMTDAVNAVTGS